MLVGDVNLLESLDVKCLLTRRLSGFQHLGFQGPACLTRTVRTSGAVGFSGCETAANASYMERRNRCLLRPENLHDISLRLLGRRRDESLVITFTSCKPGDGQHIRGSAYYSGSFIRCVQDSRIQRKGASESKGPLLLSPQHKDPY